MYNQLFFSAEKKIVAGLFFLVASLVPFIAGAQTNTPPTISGTPATSVMVGDLYTFTPTARDANGDKLTFSIANKPAWATFNATNGTLTGIPVTKGTSSNIVISVTDAKSTKVSLKAFSIQALKKYHPGHYVTIEVAKNSLSEVTGDMASLKKPGVLGLQIRYNWSELEPTKGTYNFSKIRDHITLLKNNGLKLIIYPQDKNFSTTLATPTPAYLHSAIPCTTTAFPCVLQNKVGGWTAIRWNPETRTRWKALITALGKEFDKNPVVEGIAFQESAHSLSDAALETSGYTALLYRDALIDILKQSATSFPNSQTFWFMNFLQGNQNYIAEIANAVYPAPWQVNMGGPDILPENTSLRDRTYGFYGDFKDKMILFGSMQNDSYRELCSETSRASGACVGTYWTMEEMMRWGRDNLYLKYVIWNHKTSSAPGENSWADAIPVIAKYSPTFYPETVVPKFSINQRVQATGTLNIRSSANGTLVGTQPLNAVGTVIGGPTVAGSYTWWNVNFDSGVDGWGAENWLKAYVAPPVDTTPPTAPAGLTVSALTRSGTTLYGNLLWNASSDNVGVTKYRVYTPTIVQSTTTTRFKITGLAPYTSYTYRVSAVDAAGNESAKTSLTFKTPSIAGGSAVIASGGFRSFVASVMYTGLNGIGSVLSAVVNLPVNILNLFR